MADWQIYTGSRTQHDDIERLPAPPPWRTFDGSPALPPPGESEASRHAAATYLPSQDAIRQVNAALYLRRPLLVTGPPGTGKSTLAYAVAHELGLGPILHWPITSRSTLRQGLYEYDPLSRLYAASHLQEGHPPSSGSDAQDLSRRTRDATGTEEAGSIDDIGGYIRLGPLGTALLPWERPRVLLIDEIDKSDIDLPNDLLTIFETGCYEIIELARRSAPVARVMTADSTKNRVEIHDGIVTCYQFPLVIMTSNSEREFPPAFLRRCLTLALKQPGGGAELKAIVSEHLMGLVSSTGELPEQAHQIIAHFFQRRDSGLLANDQLLNAIYLCHHAELNNPPEDVLALADHVMPYLGAEADRDDH
jgi:MoxR-like ATPase